MRWTLSMSYSTKTKIYVAMSGGVDSSVSAALLKKNGFNVTGVFFALAAVASLVVLGIVLLRATRRQRMRSRT